MSRPQARLLTYGESRDDRGALFPVPVEALEFLGSVREMHVVEMEPGAVRGNHAHGGHREALFVRFRDGCRLAWRDPEGDRTRQLAGRGAALMLVPEDVPHAVENTGRDTLYLISLASRAPVRPDPGYRRVELLPGGNPDACL